MSLLLQSQKKTLLFGVVLLDGFTVSIYLIEKKSEETKKKVVIGVFGADLLLGVVTESLGGNLSKENSNEAETGPSKSGGAS